MKWKPVKDFEEMYEVSYLGQIRNILSGKILRGNKGIQGYIKIVLYKDGKGKGIYAHRIIAQVWVSNPYNKPHINHKNGIKDDNRYVNLEWCTQQENNQHAKEMKLYKPLLGSQHGQAKLTEEIVLEIRKKSKEGITGKSLAEFYSVDPMTINRVLNRKTWKHI